MDSDTRCWTNAPSQADTVERDDKNPEHGEKLHKHERHRHLREQDPDLFLA